MRCNFFILQRTMPFTFSNIFTIAFIGVLIYQCILSGFQYSLNKQKEYWYYTAYLFILIVNFVINFYFWLYPAITSNVSQIVKQIFGLPINFFIQIIYLYFLLHYLQIENSSIPFKKKVKQQIIINGIAGTALTIYCMFGLEWGYVLNGVLVVINFILYFNLYVLLIKTKLTNYKFIIWGTVFIIAGFLINVLLTIFEAAMFYNDVTIMMGAVIEIGFFNYALQHKMKNQESALLLAEIEKQKAIENEHRRVSADLHDEVGSALSSIQIMSVISKRKMDTDIAESKKLLRLIGTQALKMQHSLSDIVWGLRTDLNSLDDMTIKMEEILKYTLEPAQITHAIELDNAINDLKLSVLQRRNILLILKEALNNILKYADAATVHIKFKSENNFLIMAIADTGKGFGSGNPTGNGLKNMETRAVQINGELLVNSVINSGTTVYCKIPLQHLN